MISVASFTNTINFHPNVYEWSLAQSSVGWNYLTIPILQRLQCCSEICEWISTCIPHFVMDIITYQCNVYTGINLG